MEKFKGTKGPWILNWSGAKYNNMLQIINDKNDEVCNFGDDEQYYPTAGLEPNDHDALLISKAPEMLEMLNSVHGEILRNDGVLDVQKWGNKIEQLIKSATEL